MEGLRDSWESFKGSLKGFRGEKKLKGKQRKLPYVVVVLYGAAARKLNKLVIFML